MAFVRGGIRRYLPRSWMEVSLGPPALHHFPLSFGYDGSTTLLLLLYEIFLYFLFSIDRWTLRIKGASRSCFLIGLPSLTQSHWGGHEGGTDSAPYRDAWYCRF